MFSLFKRRERDSILNLYAAWNYNDGYGTGKRHHSIYTLKEFLKISAKKYNCNLVTESEWGNIYFPFADVDDEASMVTSSLWLKENKLSFVTVRSSFNNYWIFIDKFCNNFKSAFEIANWVPNVDNEYMSMSARLKIQYIRLGMKDDYYVPEIINDEGCSKEIIDFVNEIIRISGSGEIAWFHRYNQYRAGKVDLASPAEFDLDFTVMDIL